MDIDEKALNRIFKRIKEIEKEIMTEEVNLAALQQKRVTLHLKLIFILMVNKNIALKVQPIFVFVELCQKL